MTEQHEDPEILRSQLAALRQGEEQLGQQILELTQQLSDRIQENQVLERRSVASEEAAESLSSQLEESLQRATDLNQQITL